MSCPLRLQESFRRFVIASAGIIALMKVLAETVQALTGFRLNSSQLAAFVCYERELIDWNTRINLTAIHNPEQIQMKHFLDSLSCLNAMQNTAYERVIDIGTGAGFPGIPLKITCPNVQLTLVESVGKKADFCRHIVQKLGLTNVQVIQERAEALGQLRDHREQYDWALARAVANMPILMEYLLPLARNGGNALAMKGSNAPAETQSAENAIRLLGGRLRRLIPVELPGIAEERYLVVVDKIASTPPGYPRRAGLPARRPL